ncbi:MAG: S1/P1 nuclease [Bacteroidales bacterium]|nr:S1/P1 nuclease [Bacteroidales bacterium]
MRKTLATLLLTLLCTVAGAWGGTEHRLMAYMAQGHLTKNTQAFLDRYLDMPIMEYATWMDRYRDSPGYKETTRWHMVSVDADGNFEPDGLGKAIPKLTKALDILRNWREYNDSTVYINIVYVIHLVPEIHCPAHYYLGKLGDAKELRRRGWQPIHIKGKEVKYHGFWDGIITRLYPGITPDQFVELFDNWTPEKQKEVSDGTPADWGRDNITRISQIYDWCQYGDTVPDDFAEQHRWLPEIQVRLGAYRLARTLNDLFDKEVTK